MKQKTQETVCLLGLLGIYINIYIFLSIFSKHIFNELNPYEPAGLYERFVSKGTHVSSSSKCESAAGGKSITQLLAQILV